MYLGYRPASSTVVIDFNSFQADGASVTITGLAVTDIEIYKDSSMVQRASDNGYTLLDTDGTDLDGITGIQGFTIDLSDNSDAGFYASGGYYRVVVSAVTIDGKTVNFTAARFDIGPGPADILTWIGTAVTLGSGAPDVNIQSSDNIALTAQQKLDVNTEADTALTDYDGPTDAEMVARTLVAASYFDPAADTVANVTTVATLTGHTAQTGDSFARLGAPAGASVSADIADVPTVAEFDARTLLAASYFDPAADTVALVTTVTTLTGHTAQTGDSFARIGAAGASLTGLGGMSAAMKAEIESEANDALVAIHLDHVFAVDYDPAAAPGVATALFNELIENDGGVSRYTVNALENAPSGGGGVAAAVWAFATRTLTQSAQSVVAAVIGTNVTVNRGDTMSVALTGIGNIAARTKLWFTVKRSVLDADSAAELQIDLTGLILLNGAAGTLGNGSITIDDETAGDITLALIAADAAKLPVGEYSFDVQMLAGATVTTLVDGRFKVAVDVTVETV